MPSTVASLFAAAGLASTGAVHWGTPIPQSASGIYVVALTDDPAAIEGTHDRAPLRKQALESLLDVRPELRLDGRRPHADELAARLASYWLADETAVYVGLATPLRSRVRSYYRTPLGAKRPHAGGWWLKTLAVLD